MKKVSDDPRAKAREMVAGNKRKDKKRKNLIAVGIVTAVILVLAVIGFVVFQDAKKSSSKEAETMASQVTPERITTEGAFYVSDNGSIAPSEDSTATRVDLFFDPQCPGCGIVDRAIGDRLEELSESGEIDLYFTPVSFLDRASTDNYSSRAANAVVTVAEKSPEHLLDFVNAIYAEDFQPGEGGNSNTSDEKLSKLAQSIGIPENVANTFKDHAYLEWISENTEFQTSRADYFSEGFSTPSLFLNTEYVEGKATGFTRVVFDNEDMLETFNNALENLPKGN